MEEDDIEQYDEDTNPSGVRRVLEDATTYLDNAVAIWKLLGEEGKASELAVLLRGLWNVYRIYSLSMCMSQLNMTVAYLRDAIELGCAVFAE